MQCHPIAEPNASLEEVLRLLAAEQEPTGPTIASANRCTCAITLRKLATGFVIAFSLSLLSMLFIQSRRTTPNEGICEGECVRSFASDFSSWKIERRSSD